MNKAENCHFAKMSLFQGLFPTSSGQKSGLFSEENRYRRQQIHNDASEERNADRLGQLSRKKRSVPREDEAAVATATPEQPVHISLRQCTCTTQT